MLNMASWKPPKSPYDLIQEHLYQDPWRVLVACIFCNLTRRHTAEPLLWKFFKMYPTPSAAMKANPPDLESFLKPIGMSKRRSLTLIRMSKEYLDDEWDEPIELYGIGKYANDAWKIFCTENWKDVQPNDHALTWYHEWALENVQQS
jgi:methyl-CpG-binding domain protein 4